MDEAGIIFVTAEDPASRLIRSLTRCEYSAVGFYAPSTSTGIRKIIVTLVDLLGIEKPTWLSSGCTLENLVRNPLITKVTVRPLRTDTDIKAAQSRFRASICRGMDSFKKAQLEEIIFSLFGYGECRDIVTGIDLINSVISIYGELNKVHAGTEDTTHPVNFKQPSDKKPNIRKSIDITTDIINTQFFGEAIHLSLPSHEAHIIETEKKRTLDQSRLYISRGISAFIDLFLAHPDFFQNINSQLGDIALRRDTNMPYEFRDIIEKIISLLTQLQITGNYTVDDIKRIKGEIEDFYLGPHLPSNNHGIKLWLNNLVHEIKASETSCHPVIINLHELISITGADINLDGLPDKIPACFIRQSTTNKSYRTKLGKVIYLDKQPNLDSFSREELIEISYHLNSLDTNYDCLREEITSYLTAFHDKT